MKNNFIIEMIKWHFYEMPAFLYSIGSNYIAFGLHYFSLPVLLATLFSPWRHYKGPKSRGFDLGEFFGNLIYNAFSRVMGFFCRLFLILAGIIFLLLVAIVGFLTILFWIFLPLIIILLIFALFYV